MGHYLPLDGTVFHDSRSVDSEPFIGMGSLGVTVRHGGFVLSLAATFFTDTFENQRESAEFGTLSMSWELLTLRPRVAQRCAHTGERGNSRVLTMKARQWPDLKPASRRADSAQAWLSYH